MSRQTVVPISTPPTPESMGELIELAVYAQGAKAKIREASPARGDEGKEKDEPTTYTIRPKEGVKLHASEWKPAGQNWSSTGEKEEITSDHPFHATTWRADQSDGLGFYFYSNNLSRSEEGDALKPHWRLHVPAEDLNNIRVREEREGEIVSEWLGRGAISGAGEAPVA